MTDEELYHNEWISLRIVKAPEQGVKGYVYSREVRCNAQIVSILPYRKAEQKEGDVKGNKTHYMYLPNGNQFAYEYLLKSEITPCWSVRGGAPLLPHLSTITGGVEGNDAFKSALAELKEETGYSVKGEELFFLGHCFASKSSDTIYYLYTVDLTGKRKGKATGDGSALEANSKALWKLEDDVLRCFDPLASVLFLRVQEHFRKPKSKTTHM